MQRKREKEENKDQIKMSHLVWGLHHDYAGVSVSANGFDKQDCLLHFTPLHSTSLTYSHQTSWRVYKIHKRPQIVKKGTHYQHALQVLERAEKEKE
jgi:hypothetical protein